MSETQAPETHAGPLLAGRYRLDRLIASGGMAQVWEAIDEVLSRRVAVKILHPHLAADAIFVARFRREAVAAARLVHPSIVAIYDTHSDDNVEAIVMELVRGRTLRQELDARPERVLEPFEAAAVVAEVAEALDVAHKAGVVHRDVKPGNVLLSEDGRVMVTDFGIAKALQEGEGDLTVTGTTLGTVKYLAPEQVEGEPVDARTDVYALGVILYELVCGRPPFTGDSDAAVALARLTQPPLRPRQVRAGVPRPLERVIMRALAREPADRYESAGDLRAALLVAERNELDDPSFESSLGFDVTSSSGGFTVTRPRHAAPSPAANRGFARTERGWLVPAVLIIMLGVGLGVAGVLFSSTDAGRRLLGRPPATDAVPPAELGSPLQLAEVTTFDPQGDDRERPDLASRAVDGQPDTEWQTEGYASRDFGNLKDGVGLILALDEATTLNSLRITSPSQDWTAQVYVADQPGTGLDDWGDPVATNENIETADVAFDLGGTTGRYVLLWITRPADDGDRYRVRIAEAVLEG
ncbi:MAG: protein kinase domain-containing protein [Acidimicrobiales bacterium]